MLTKSPLIAVLGTCLGLVVLSYFVFMTWKGDVFARIMYRRGYEAEGFSIDSLALRFRILGVLGITLSLAAILLAITRF
jgi:hypothetical protein